MKTKGFTIVELAIVLVVIGIILSMAVKGKQLVDAARFKAEVNKIRKLEAAMHIWVATHPEFIMNPYKANSHVGDTVNLQGLYDAGIVSEGDLRSYYADAQGANDYIYTPILCKEGSSGLFNIALPNAYAGAEMRQFCAILSGASNFMIGSPPEPMMSIHSFPLRLQCGIETMLDDENLATGLARRMETAATPILDDFTPEVYADCMALSAEPLTDVTGKSSTYMLF